MAVSLLDNAYRLVHIARVFEDNVISYNHIDTRILIDNNPLAEAFFGETDLT